MSRKTGAGGFLHGSGGDGGVFDRNSPRPPVPGEERVHYVADWGHPMAHPSLPKKTFCIPNEPYVEADSKPLSRHEKAATATGSGTPETSPPAACLRWASSLHHLLEDPDGVELYKRYLQAEGRPHVDALDFWFACEGLRKQCEPDRVQQLVKVIYKRYFLKSALPISEDLKHDVGRSLKSSSCGYQQIQYLFDDAQAQVENLINRTTYPNFIKSDMYLQYIQSVQNPTGSSGEFSSESSSSSSSVSTSNKDPTNLTSNAGLPIIHEDMEFEPSTITGLTYTPGTGSMSTGYQTPNIRLTKDMLLATQKNRAFEVRPKPEAFAADMYMYRGTGHHVAYNSYNPVSRQDSEMQSLSSHSDARTESDNLSLTDSSVDGRSLQKASKRRVAAAEARAARESAALNRETHMHQAVIPRTQRLEKQQMQPLRPDEFAAILIEKLEFVKRDRDSQKLLERKLNETDPLLAANSNNDPSRTNEVQSKELANAIRERLQLEDDNDQDILDQHVMRVFSDRTPQIQSPGGLRSPRTHSPVRGGGGGPRGWQHEYVRPPAGRCRREPRGDGFSTFSGDSGNVHDYVPEPPSASSGHRGSGTGAMVKSKSVPDYGDERDRFVRASATRRSSSKKTLTDFTDSGVSVVSDIPPMGHGNQKDHRVLTWLVDSDRGSRTVTHTHSEMSSKHRGHRSTSATSPNANRHRKGYGSRSSSVERSGASSTLGPAQPFVADPSMPPLPHPNIAVQLEEARRRLEEDGRNNRSKQRTSSKHYPELTQSSQSTLRKSMRGQRPSMAGTEEVTTVVFSFCDEQFPYRTKIPGTQVTLKQFKEYLPKKGSYRYFFKTVCEELDNQVIQEEVSNDSDILPLWEGRINAQVKAID